MASLQGPGVPILGGSVGILGNRIVPGQGRGVSYLPGGRRPRGKKKDYAWGGGNFVENLENDYAKKKRVLTQEGNRGQSRVGGPEGGVFEGKTFATEKKPAPTEGFSPSQKIPPYSNFKKRGTSPITARNRRRSWRSISWRRPGEGGS